MNRQLLPALLLIACPLITHAQATLTGANSNPVIGDAFYGHVCATAGVNEGTSGASITWDFHTLITQTVDTFEYVACAATPYCDSFPGAQMAVKNGTSFYDYYATTANTNLYLGSFYYIDSTDYFYEHCTDPITITYPITYNTSYIDSAYVSGVFNYMGSPMPSANNQNTATTCDGYGTLVLPSGTFSNVLRLHNVTTIYDSFGITPGVTQSYMWYTPGMHAPLMIISYNLDSIGNYDLSYVGYNTGTLPTGIVETKGILASLQLFPNPASDELHIRFSATNAKQVHISLTDLVGREVDILDDEKCIVGDNELKYTTTSLPKGIYLVRLQTDSETIVKKVLIH